MVRMHWWHDVSTWLQDAWGHLGLLITVFGSILTAQAFVAWIRAWWHRGPGRRRGWVNNYYRLAPGTRIEYVRAMFGAPTFQDNYPFTVPVPDGGEEREESYVGYLWKLADDGYLQVLADEADTVCRYSLTTTSRHFRPTVPIGTPAGYQPRFWVTLGVSRFADLPWADVSAINWSLGARRMHYAESYYYGNPGGYATWICSSNDAGYPRLHDFVYGDLPALTFLQTPDEWLSGLEDSVRQQLMRLRRTGCVNTVTVSSAAAARTLISPLGPDMDTVRMLGRPYRRSLAALIKDKMALVKTRWRSS